RQAAELRGQFLALTGGLSILPPEDCLPNDRAACAVSGETTFPFAKRIGANDAVHREHLMVPARQLTSPAPTLRAMDAFHFPRQFARIEFRFGLNLGCTDGNRHTSAA